MNMKFYSETLKEPQLKFGRDTYEVSPINGLRIGGPYDIAFISQVKFNGLLIYPQSEKAIADEFILKFNNGEPPFGGFADLFKKSININHKPLQYTINEFEEQIKDIIQSASEQIDIVFILLPEGVDESFYYKGKLVFGSQGIPSQFFSKTKFKENLDRGRLGYYLQNFSLAVYAKLGRKAWVLARMGNMGSDIIIGVGGTRINGKNCFAFTTLFERNGAFDWWSADIPDDPTDGTEYVNLLKNQIIGAIKEYKKQNPDIPVEKISFHISGKRPGRLEIQAIREAMEELQEDFKFAIFHINTTSPLWIMDESNNTKFFHPPKGLKVRLSSKDFLLITDEPQTNPRAPIHPIRVTLIEHNFQNEEYKNIHVMVDEIYHLTKMNWKGFRTKNIPVSVHYPRLIARFLEKFKIYGGKEFIIAMRSNIQLRRKAWFL